MIVQRVENIYTAATYTVTLSKPLWLSYTIQAFTEHAHVHVMLMSTATQRQTEGYERPDSNHPTNEPLSYGRTYGRIPLMSLSHMPLGMSIQIEEVSTYGIKVYP